MWEANGLTYTHTLYYKHNWMTVKAEGKGRLEATKQASGWGFPENRYMTTA